MRSPDGAVTVARWRRAGVIRPAVVLGSVLLGLASVLLVLAWVPAALAASPGPTQPAGGDPRSAGQGPGLVGDPLLAIVVVALIGLAALVVTLAYVRATGGARRS